MAVTMKIVALLDFNGICWFHLHCRRLCPAWKVVVQVKVGGWGTVIKTLNEPIGMITLN
jgi:hypothetical protein